jgi:hypothetical protein
LEHGIYVPGAGYLLMGRLRQRNPRAHIIMTYEDPQEFRDMREFDEKSFLQVEWPVPLDNNRAVSDALSMARLAYYRGR